MSGFESFINILGSLLVGIAIILMSCVAFCGFIILLPIVAPDPRSAWFIFNVIFGNWFTSFIHFNDLENQSLLYRHVYAG